MDDDTCLFLSDCEIKFEKIEELDGMIISREFLLSKNLYDKVKPKIKVMKKKFSSSSMTSLQKQAELNQRWPLLNLVRQILRVCKYKMIPIRKSNGSDETGKKLYKRFFKIILIKEEET